MLVDSICLILGNIKLIDNNFPNLEEALATPQTSMVDLTTLDLASGGPDVVSLPTAQEHINSSLHPPTLSLQSLLFSSFSISPLIDRPSRQSGNGNSMHSTALELPTE